MGNKTHNENLLGIGDAVLDVTLLCCSCADRMTGTRDNLVMMCIPKGLSSICWSYKITLTVFYVYTNK